MRQVAATTTVTLNSQVAEHFVLNAQQQVATMRQHAALPNQRSNARIVVVPLIQALKARKTDDGHTMRRRKEKESLRLWLRLRLRLRTGVH